jgi:hypothetical protein
VAPCSGDDWMADGVGRAVRDGRLRRLAMVSRLSSTAAAVRLSGARSATHVGSIRPARIRDRDVAARGRRSRSGRAVADRTGDAIWPRTPPFAHLAHHHSTAASKGTPDHKNAPTSTCNRLHNRFTATCASQAAVPRNAEPRLSRSAADHGDQTSCSSPPHPAAGKTPTCGVLIWLRRHRALGCPGAQPCRDCVIR